MHVIHLINGEYYSGAERVQDLLAMLLPKSECAVTLGCLKPGIFAEKCACERSIIVDFPMGLKFNLFPACRIVRFIKENNVDLIHSHTPRAALIGSVASLLSGKPMVHHVHSPSIAETDNKLRNQMLYHIEKLCMLHAKHLIPVSNSLKQYLLDMGMDAGNISVVHNGVPSVGPLSAKPTPNEGMVLGMVALFRPRKGLEILLEAVAVLIGELNLTIRLIGPFESEEYKRSIQKYAADILPHASVVYVGFVSDVDRELRNVDAMVLPSLFGEGLPMVVLEAMASGTPVIATRVQGVPEAIEDGKSGILAFPGDVGSMAQAIAKLATGAIDYQSLRSEAYQRHQDLFSAVKMAESVYEVYNKVLSS